MRYDDEPRRRALDRKSRPGWPIRLTEQQQPPKHEEQDA